MGQVGATVWDPMFAALALPHLSLPGSALLLFLAMPMLTVGGILFLITNLQV